MPAMHAARAACVAFVDVQAELRAAAAWTRAGLEAGAQHIGIVVPDLASQRAAVIRVFDEALVPQALLPGAQAVRPYNVSLGEPLANVPLVHAALAILSAGSGPLPMNTASQLLRMPFLAGHAEEQAARARIDLELRQIGEVSLTAHGLMRTVQEEHKAGAAVSKLAAQTKAWRDMLPSKSQRLPPSGCACPRRRDRPGAESSSSRRAARPSVAPGRHRPSGQTFVRSRSACYHRHHGRPDPR